MKGDVAQALLPAVAAAPVVYALVRAIEVVGAEAIDPATVVWVTPIQLFFRVASVLYVTAMLSIVSFVICRRHPAWPLRTAGVLVPVGITAALLQAAFAP